MQVSLFTVNVWQILAGASTSWHQVLIARLLGGLCSAGGSVTLGMVADMFEPEDQQMPILWVSLWSCLGSGMSSYYLAVKYDLLTLASHRWNLWWSD